MLSSLKGPNDVLYYVECVSFQIFLHGVSISGIYDSVFIILFRVWILCFFLFLKIILLSMLTWCWCVKELYSCFTLVSCLVILKAKLKAFKCSLLKIVSLKLANWKFNWLVFHNRIIVGHLLSWVQMRGNYLV